MTREKLERGAASTEAVILAPALFILLGLLLAVGSVAMGQQAVTTAAHAAARSASLATSEDDAVYLVEDAFTQQLTAHDRACDDVRVDVDASAFDSSPGTAATITTTITCTMPYASVIPVPGLPGSRTITVSTTSPLDTYRERS